MRKASQVTAFYVEVLILTVGMILIVLVLTQVFALGRMQSASAEELTDAVCLAQNAAEAVASSRSPKELLQTLGEDGNCGYDESASPPVVWAAYDTQMRPDAQGAILLCVTWEADDAEKGELVHSTITVTDRADEHVIYTLRTAVFIKEAER